MARDWFDRLPRPALVGETLNAAGNARLAARLAAGDWGAVDEAARAQAAAGAHLLDVCGARPARTHDLASPAPGPAAERSTLLAMLDRVRAASDLPVAVDSRDATLALDAIESLSAAGRPAILNSIPATRDAIERALPRAARLGVPIVALALDEAGVPATAEERFVCAERVVRAARALGLAADRVIVDCLALPAPAVARRASGSHSVTFAAMRLVKSRLGAPLILGISNVSFGTTPPSARREANAAFLAEALQAGLDFAIADALDSGIRRALGL